MVAKSQSSAQDLGYIVAATTRLLGVNGLHYCNIEPEISDDIRTQLLHSSTKGLNMPQSSPHTLYGRHGSVGITTSNKSRPGLRRAQCSLRMLCSDHTPANQYVVIGSRSMYPIVICSDQSIADIDAGSAATAPDDSGRKKGHCVHWRRCKLQCKKMIELNLYRHECRRSIGRKRARNRINHLTLCG